MQNEEFYEKLKAMLKDEHDGQDEYTKLAMMAPDERYKAILMDIADEEATHAKHLKDILKDADMDCHTPEMDEAEEKAEEAAE